MINPAVFTTTFLAAAVEIIEMVIIVVGVGAIRGWRSTLLGTGAGLAVVAALILALGTALTHVPIDVLRLVAGILLSAFGSFWAAEGLGIAWPGADLFIIVLAAWYVLAAAWYIRRLRRQTRHASQLTPQHAR